MSKKKAPKMDQLYNFIKRLEREEKVKRYRVTVEVYGSRNEDGRLSIIATLPSKIISATEIKENNTETILKGICTTDARVVREVR